MNKNYHATRGITLLETLVVLTLFILISGAMAALYLQYNSLYALGEVQFTTVGDSRTVLNSLSVYTIQAHRVTSTYTFGGVVRSSSSSTLIVQLPAIDNNGSVISNVWDYAAFYRSGMNVYRTVAPHAQSSRAPGTRLLSNIISNMSFTYNSGSFDSITKVSVTLDSSNQSGRVTADNHLTSEFVLRNF